MTFLDIVGEAFLSTRGRGLVLSPVDVTLLRTYEASGVPAPILVRGILRAAERRRANGKPPPPPPSTPSSAHSTPRPATSTPARCAAAPSPSAEQLDALLAAAREAPLPEERAAYRAGYRAACAGEDTREAAALAWLGGLPRSLQRATASAIREGLGPRLAPEPREEYRVRLRRALVADAIQRANLEL